MQLSKSTAIAMQQKLDMQLSNRTAIAMPKKEWTFLKAQSQKVNM